MAFVETAVQKPSSNNGYYGVMLSFWAGAATGLGAILIVGIMDRFKGDKGIQGVLAFSLAMAAGVMISVSVVDLWLPLVKIDGIMLPSLAVGVGMGAFQGIAQLLNSTKLCQQHHQHSHQQGHQQSILPLSESKADEKVLIANQQRNLKVAAMMFLALTLHNFPEGLAVSVSASSSKELGFTIALAVAFHNGPEGMAIAAPYYAATGSRFGSIGLAFLSGLSEPLGALASVMLLGPFLQAHPTVVPYILCGVAGIMLASALVELLPEARSYNRSDLVIYGFVVGTITMLLTIWVT